MLSEKAMLIGRDGNNTLEIATENPTQALGLAIVTGTPIAEAEREETTDGVLIVNPAR